MIDHPAQLAGDVADALPAPLAILLETASQHVVEQRMRRLKRGDRRRLAPHDRRNHRDGDGALERLASREHLVEHATEGEDVGAVIARVAIELLGRHVLQGAESARRGRGRRRACRRQCRRHVSRQRGVDRLRTRHSRSCGQPEVEQLDVGWTRRACRAGASGEGGTASPHQHHVARLQIAMRDAGAVRAVERVADLDGNRERFIDRKLRRSA